MRTLDSKMKSKMYNVESKDNKFSAYSTTKSKVYNVVFKTGVPKVGLEGRIWPSKRFDLPVK